MKEFSEPEAEVIELGDSVVTGSGGIGWQIGTETCPGDVASGGITECANAKADVHDGLDF